MRSSAMHLSNQARVSIRKKASIACFAFTAIVGFGSLQAAAQSTATQAAASAPSAAVSRTAKVVTYRRGSGAVRVSISGTDLMPRILAEATVENKGSRVEIEANFQGMEEASKFGFEYLTYVLWAVSPQGRAVNLGEVLVKNGNAQVKAITDMQTFAMVVTAEPYFAVSQPGDEVVAENAEYAGSEGIQATYSLLGRGVYSSSNTRIDNVIFGIDRKTPVELFEARNALRIAGNANASQFATAVFAKANQQLQEAEESYRQKRDKKTVISEARDAVQTAEEARVISVKAKAELDAQAQAAAERQAAEGRAAKARADAEAEANRRQAAEQARVQAEQARQQAEAAKAEAERMKQEALQAAAAAAKAKEEADRARQAAIVEQQAALVQKQAAESEATKARQAAAKAEAEKAGLRAQLRAQLNSILQTDDSARGLIVNMSDVLFDTGSVTLKPGAREKLAKVSGIVLAHPGLTLQVEGHTDSVGGDELNQRLSEQRAGSVREFLIGQGLNDSAITAEGFGKTEPVATNDTPEGRQRNRRVEIVVNGDSIDTSSAAMEQADH
ncbi:MAG TPA: OmpA family protein [Verrucomicrobiae bacterium]|jgi:outer membrane protein OmpA-like peptidoglycan-associated protein|nr:OmpA family protein [Verrucomicrobiae bacterium]